MWNTGEGGEQEREWASNMLGKTPNVLGHSMPDPASVGSGLNLFPWALCISKHNPLGQPANISPKFILHFAK